MKKTILILLSLLIQPAAYMQEYATFELTGLHQGTGNFNNAVLSDFVWEVSGTLTDEVEILDDEIFNDGNAFENTFGQADNAQNLRIQVAMNGPGTQGQPLTSRAVMTLHFDQLTPPDLWGFCVVDIDVENCLIAAIDENDNEVPAAVIDGWLIELFDANLEEDGVNLPKWDPAHAALLGSDTPENYLVYDSLVIGGMPSSEAPAAFFMPDIPLQSLTIVFENLQDVYNTSYHFYIASMYSMEVVSQERDEFRVFPVPASEWLEVKFDPQKKENPAIMITDLIGKVYIYQEITGNATRAGIDISRLPKGVYFCRIQSGKDIMVRRIIKQ